MQVKPLFENLEEKISTSEFYDVIEKKSTIWQITENFKENSDLFYDTIKNAEDSELVFDKIECSRKLEEYKNTQLVVKRHLLELIELKGKTIMYHQPF
jgi:hypothetical protein